MSKTKLILIITLSFIVIVCLSIPIGIYSSNRLSVKNYNIIVDKNAKTLTIAHISDLHYPYIKISLSDILSALEDTNPDFIFLTGDIIDSSTTKEDVTKLNGFLNRLGKYPKVYAVLGNHEAINDSLSYYKSLLKINNITLLENKAELVSYNNKKVIIAGVSDKVIYSYDKVEGLQLLEDAPVLLLAHRPEKFENYLNETEDKKPLVVFSGHNHGGQAQIFGVGLISPATGIFPKYYDGLYKKDSSYMIVSRGLGDSIVPVRFFNSYHLPIAKIKF